MLSHRKVSRFITTTKKYPKGFWKHINEQRKEQGLPSSMSFEGELASSQEDIFHLFALKFSRAFVNEATTPSQVSAAANNVPLNGQSLNIISVDDSCLTRATSKLKSSCSAGPDGIPSIMLKKCIAGLIYPLRHLFNLSLSSGIFPALWKIAYMFPVHKKGDKRNVDNYRGISALCATSKLFELVVLDPISSHCKSLIVDTQHGFLPGRSTTTNLLDFTSYILDGMSKGLQTDAIYTDLSAAFDKLDHNIAVAKLERMGFSGSLLRWFSSYLTGRSLCVKIGDLLSFWFQAWSGIAQGSHLGPLVFLLYFNDSSLALPSLCLSYADDLKLFLRINSIADAQLLQTALTSFATWCHTNRMVLNPKKCCVISFSRKKKPITFDYRLQNEVVPRESCVKDLGVLLDSEMTFKHHVSSIVDKASRQLGFIFRTTKRFTDIYCLKALFCSLVRSTLEYSSAVWSPYYQNGVKRIEDVQRRFIRFALRRLPWNDPFRLPSYESRCRLIHLDNLEVRRNVARALVVADCLASRLDCPALLQRINLHVPSRPLRDSTLIRLPFHRTNYCMYGAFSGILRVFNRVSSHFDFSLSRDALKHRFFTHFRS